MLPFRWTLHKHLFKSIKIRTWLGSTFWNCSLLGRGYLFISSAVSASVFRQPERQQAKRAIPAKRIRIRASPLENVASASLPKSHRSLGQEVNPDRPTDIPMTAGDPLTVAFLELGDEGQRRFRDHLRSQFHGLSFKSADGLHNLQ